MKIRNLLNALLLVAILAFAFAVPIMAQDEPTTMFVQRARLAHTGRSSHSPDAIVAYIHVRDETLAMVPGVAVTVQWTLPDGTQYLETAISEFQGIASFSDWAGRGTYKVCVIDMVKTGWLWNPALDLESCPVFVVP